MQENSKTESTKLETERLGEERTHEWQKSGKSSKNQTGVYLEASAGLECKAPNKVPLG